MRLFTIGFTKKSAEAFFTKLRQAGVKRLIDVRLNNTSQLAGFTKQDDLRYFLKAICDIDYAHIPELAPTKDILDSYRKKSDDWTIYETGYLALLKQRKVEETLRPDQFDGACLLCGESEPDHCHRRLAAEYLKDRWGDIDIIHIP